MKVIIISVLRTGRLYPFQVIFLIFFSGRSSVDPKAIVRPEVLSQWKVSMILPVIDPATFQLAALSLKQRKASVRKSVPNSVGLRYFERTFLYAEYALRVWVNSRQHLRIMSAYNFGSVRGQSMYRPQTMSCVHTCLACPVNEAMSLSEVAARMCAGYVVLTSRKKFSKQPKHFWTRRSFNDGFQHGNNFLRELLDEKWLSDLASENWPQYPKGRYKIWRSNSCLKPDNSNAKIRVFSQRWLIYKSGVHFQNIYDCPRSL